MASYQGHLMFSSVLGAAYGSAAAYLGLDWGTVFLGAGLTTLGGLLPDLDSDSGVPVRELFGLAAVVIPFLLVPRLPPSFNMEQRLVALGGAYLFIRYLLAQFFRRVTVHRGMFHSIPALLITGLVVFLAYGGPSPFIRLALATGTMIGFLSHLVLDELCSVDFMGVTLKLNQYAGSALKFVSPSWVATLTCYVLLAGLGYLTWLDLGSPADLKGVAIDWPQPLRAAADWSNPQRRAP